MRLLPTPLLLATLLSLSQCKKIDPTPAPPPSQLDLLPPATQTGQRTFGCLLNGQAWTPAGSPFGGPLFIAQYYNRTLTLAANRGIIFNGKSISDLIQINISGINLPGSYTLIRPDTSFVNYNDLINKCNYYTNPTHSATVVITKLDLINRIVSGTFAFTLETPTCGKVTVTDGRFDSLF